MLKTKISSILVILIMAVVFAACGSAANGTPTEAPEVIFTRVAETVFYSVTQTADAMPTSTPTPNPPTPTVTIIVSPTIQTTSSVVVPTVGVTQSSSQGSQPGEFACWDKNSPDNFHMSPGSSIENEVVGLKNLTTTTWNTSYTLRFIGGTQMWGKTSIPVSKIVKPGERVEFFMAVFAPGENGTFLSHWALFTDAGVQVPGCKGYVKVLVP